MLFVKQYLRKCSKSELVALHVAGVWWEADAHYLCHSSLRLLSWMDLDYFFQKTLSPLAADT